MASSATGPTSCASPWRSAGSRCRGRPPSLRDARASARFAHEREDRERGREEEAGEQYRQPVVSPREPGDRAVGERTEDRGEARRHAPEAEELAAAPGGREIRLERAPGRLARPH